MRLARTSRRSGCRGPLRVRPLPPLFEVPHHQWYAPRLRSQLDREQQLAQNGAERGWPRKVERHNAITDRIRYLLADLGESIDPGPDDHC
ncbi:hypothetical protein LT493_42415 [Streptomyces tricolor]|nr:hypothetical protein [Streptomyces tricolor]